MREIQAGPLYPLDPLGPWGSSDHQLGVVLRDPSRGAGEDLLLARMSVVGSLELVLFEKLGMRLVVPSIGMWEVSATWMLWETGMGVAHRYSLVSLIISAPIRSPRVYHGK